MKYIKGDRVVMADPSYHGSCIPKGTKGTVNYTSNVGSIVVNWDEFTDIHGNFVGGKLRNNWPMIPEEITPAQ